MCLLTYFPEHSTPDMDRLEYGAIHNPDGHGFAIVDVNERRLIVYRHMAADRVLEAFDDLRGLHPEGPALFHSRIGTAGDYDEDNCHPFYVGGDKRTVIGHNGILPNKAQPDKKDARSDTRLLAELFLPKGRFGAVHTHGGRKQLGKWAGWGNKFAILTVNPKMCQGAAGKGFIVNEFQGEWLEGPTGSVWYSNDSHEPYMPRIASRYSWENTPATPYSNGYWRKGDDNNLEWVELHDSSPVVMGAPKVKVEVCPFCEAKESYGAERLPTICQACWGCKMCLDDITECACYSEFDKSESVNDYVKWWAASCETSEAKSLWAVD